MLYLYLVFSVALLVALLFKPYQVSALFKRKRIYLPLTVGITGLIVLFFRSAYMEHAKNYVDLPQGVTHDHGSTAYLEWAKNRYKLERDSYLSLSCILAQMFLVTVSHWIQKYRAFVEFTERSKHSD